MRTPREDVYAVIDGERAYQDAQWGENLSAERKPNVEAGERGGDRTLDEFVLYMLGYMNATVTLASSTSNKKLILDNIRKVTALGVHCMEQHGAPDRK